MHELASLDARDLSFTSVKRKYSATGAYCQSELGQVQSSALFFFSSTSLSGDLALLSMCPYLTCSANSSLRRCAIVGVTWQGTIPHVCCDLSDDKSFSIT